MRETFNFNTTKTLHFEKGGETFSVTVNISNASEKEIGKGKDFLKTLFDDILSLL